MCPWCAGIATFCIAIILWCFGIATFASPLFSGALVLLPLHHGGHEVSLLLAQAYFLVSMVSVETTTGVTPFLKSKASKKAARSCNSCLLRS